MHSARLTSIRGFFLNLILCLLSISQWAFGWGIPIEIEINDQKLQLFLDTGASYTVLNQEKATEIGLQSLPFAEADKMQIPKGVDISPRVSMKIGELEHEGPVLIFDVQQEAAPVFGDGFLGWDFLKTVITLIDLEKKKVQFNSALPELEQWQAFPIVEQAKVLVVLADSKRARPRLFTMIDTGSVAAFELAPKIWSRYSKDFLSRKFTLTTTYSKQGFFVRRNFLVQGPRLGDLRFKKVVMSEMSSSASGPLVASLGLRAFSSDAEAQILIDGPGKQLYLSPNALSSSPSYNRLGATFMPKGENLIAHVAPASPAYNAGMRDDDILLGINDLDVTKWENNPKILPLSRFWEKNEGVEYSLTWKRKQKIERKIVCLKDFLSSD